MRKIHKTLIAKISYVDYVKFYAEHIQWLDKVTMHEYDKAGNIANDPIGILGERLFNIDPYRIEVDILAKMREIEQQQLRLKGGRKIKVGVEDLVAIVNERWSMKSSFEEMDLVKDFAKKYGIELKDKK